MRLIEPKTFRLELDALDCIDKFGYVILPITKLNVALERSTVDAEHVVRCRECKYGSKCIMDMIQCKVYDRLHSADWFCKGGERKDGGTEE